MNIRKFIAPTARQALRNIRSELGDEAVILSNRKVGDGVEIIALANGEIDRITGSVTRSNAHKPERKEQAASSQPAAPEASNTADASILGEIKSMHGMLQQQLAELSWNGVQQRDPLAAGCCATCSTPVSARNWPASCWKDCRPAKRRVHRGSTRC